MRLPLDIPLLIRTKKGDAEYSGLPGIKNSRLLQSREGGTFGMVRSGGCQMHAGWDIYAPVNTPIVAIANGEIEDVSTQRGYGRVCVLKFQYQDSQNANNQRELFAFYAHLCQVSVSKGQSVSEGDILGYTGTSGNAHGTPPHLHFEIRRKASGDQVSPGTVLGGHYDLRA